MIRFGAAYYPEHRPESSWEADCRLMQDANVNSLRVGEFAWSRFEPTCGCYDFDWLDRFLTIADRHGIQVLLCPPLRTPPQWLCDLDPSVVIESQEGRRQRFGGRYRYCINNPTLLDFGTRLASTMVARYGEDKRICGWHIDNEIGCELDCHCPVCTSAFRKWCLDRYGSIKELNEKWGLAFWGLQFTGFDRIQTPDDGFAGTGPGHGIAWRRFRSDCNVAVGARIAAALRGAAGQPITTNNQPLWNFRTDYFELDQHLDVCGTNYYPPLSGNTRAIAMGLTLARCYRGPRQTFEVHELRNAPHMIPGSGGGNRSLPGAVERLGMHAIANGAEAVYYFRWDACPFGHEQNHGTIQGYDGKARRVYAEVQRLGAKLERLSPLIEGSRVPSRIGMLYDFPSRWDFERKQNFSGAHELYLDNQKMLHRVIRDQGYAVDVCGRSTDWSPYDLIVVPMLSCCDDALAQRLVDFVKGGGRLVWHPYSAMRDSDGCIFPDRIHPLLRELLSCRVQEYEPAEADGLRFRWNERSWTGGMIADLPENVDETAVQGRFEEDWFAGTPAVIEQAAGNGRIHYCCCFAEPDFYAAWLASICESCGIERILPEPPPAAIEVCERRHEDGRRLIFLINQSHEKQMIDLPRAQDVYNEEDVDGDTAIAPLGVRVLLMK